VGLLGRREKDFNQTFEGGDGVILFFSGFFLDFLKRSHKCVKSFWEFVTTFTARLVSK